METVDVNRLNKVARHLAKLTNNQVAPVIPTENGFTHEQNCWGFVAQAMGWVCDRTWLESDAMERFLKDHTISIDPKQRRVGDIEVLRYSDVGWSNCPPGTLKHTAIIVSPATGIVMHKAGTAPVSICSQKGLTTEWYPNSSIEFVRPIGGGNGRPN